ncbi:Conserved_hypothetical protein [Hexamita inflata]|uniref:MORN repeat protein n=1 Tax=Hexamita inflata TaxID=28002 RepID=A0AA86PG21_9EUKA|nr:Conserved hypothetical protein [Hexamita inflata]
MKLQIVPRTLDEQQQLSPSIKITTKHIFYGNGTITFKSGLKITFDFEDDSQTGPGSCTFPNGDQFGGYFKNCLFNGKGTYSFANGDKYTGTWVDNELSQGTAVYANEVKYVGSFENGKRSGQASLTYKKNIFRGLFEDDLVVGGLVQYRNGEQYSVFDANPYIIDILINQNQIYSNEKVIKTKTLLQGAKYERKQLEIFVIEGWFVNSKLQGTGYCIWLSGDYYIGTFTNNVPNGTGFFKSASYKYYGSIKMEKYEGEGKMIYANGNMYEGFWENNVQEGVGCITTVNENTFEGLFKKGKIVSGLITFVNGDKYTVLKANCHFVDSFIEKLMQKVFFDQSLLSASDLQKIFKGQLSIVDDEEQSMKTTIQTVNSIKKMEFGTVNYANGDVYSGNWANGMRNGTGKQIFSNGDEYEGEWMNDQYHGLGVLTFADGSQYSGTFVNNLYSEGVLFCTDRCCYSGPFMNGREHGLGQKTWPNQTILKGNFKNGRVSGACTIKFIEGSVFFGICEENRQLSGTFTYPDGTKTILNSNIDDGFERVSDIQFMNQVIDKLQNNVFNKKYVLKRVETRNQIQEGWFQDDKLEDFGFTYQKHNFTYVGMYKNGLCNGKGKQTWSSGDSYEGDFENDTLHGNGIFTNADFNNKIIGTFFNGLFQEGIVEFANGKKVKVKKSENKQMGHQIAEKLMNTKEFNIKCLTEEEKELVEEE